MNTRLMIEATKANNAGDCTVYVEVSVSNQTEKKKTVRIPTNIKINADSWSAKSQSIIRGKSKDYYKINQMLISQKELVTDIIAELSQKGRFQLSEIKQRYIEKTAPITLDFFEIYDAWLAIKEQKMSRNGIKDFKTLKTHLSGFEKSRKDKIVLSEIDSTFFEKFEIYLSHLKIVEKSKDNDEAKTKLFADSTILKNLQTLRVYLNSQRDKGLPINLTYKKFKIKSKPLPALITLEPDEFRLLLKKLENERLEKVRQLFVLQCSTGLRYSDVVKIRKNHVRSNVIYMNSTKTRQKLQIPLNDNSNEILTGCNFDASRISISNQKYNDYIKELCDHIGINQPIMRISYRGNKEIQEPLKKSEIMSSHHGRRFFITQNLINGVRPEVIMSMTGHVDFRSFKKYIAITDQTRVNAMELWSKTFGKTEDLTQ
jgi:integrase